jgi:hypothetical protein
MRQAALPCGEVLAAAWWRCEEPTRGCAQLASHPRQGGRGQAADVGPQDCRSAWEAALQPATQQWSAPARERHLCRHARCCRGTLSLRLPRSCRIRCLPFQACCWSNSPRRGLARPDPQRPRALPLALLAAGAAEAVVCRSLHLCGLRRPRPRRRARLLPRCVRPVSRLARAFPRHA